MIDRFISAQNQVYSQVVSELAQGKKTSHWIWFIFPQLAGLGTSRNAQYFGIKDSSEARGYLEVDELHSRLIECAQLLLKHRGKEINEILPYPDDRKLQSSMTLFTLIAPTEIVFLEVLKCFFQSKLDEQTVALLAAESS